MILLSRLHFGVRCKAVWEFLQTFIEFLLTEILFLLLEILFGSREINFWGISHHNYVIMKVSDGRLPSGTEYI